MPPYVLAAAVLVLVRCCCGDACVRGCPVHMARLIWLANIRLAANGAQRDGAQPPACCPDGLHQHSGVFLDVIACFAALHDLQIGFRQVSAAMARGAVSSQLRRPRWARLPETRSNQWLSNAPRVWRNDKHHTRCAVKITGDSSFAGGVPPARDNGVLIDWLPELMVVHMR